MSKAPRVFSVAVYRKVLLVDDLISPVYMDYTYHSYDKLWLYFSVGEQWRVEETQQILSFGSVLRVRF